MRIYPPFSTPEGKRKWCPKWHPPNYAYIPRYKLIASRFLRSRAINCSHLTRLRRKLTFGGVGRSVIGTSRTLRRPLRKLYCVRYKKIWKGGDWGDDPSLPPDSSIWPSCLVVLDLIPSQLWSLKVFAAPVRKIAAPQFWHQFFSGHHSGPGLTPPQGTTRAHDCKKVATPCRPRCRP